MSEETKTPDPGTTADTAAMAQEIAALKAQNEATEAKFAQMRATQRQKDAVAFATRMVEGARILPHLQGRLAAAYAAALADDEATPGAVSFTDTTGTTQAASRADLLAALFEGLTPHGLTAEQIPGAIAMAAAPHAAAGKTEAEADAELLAETPLGQAALDHAAGRK